MKTIIYPTALLMICLLGFNVRAQSTMHSKFILKKDPAINLIGQQQDLQKVKSDTIKPVVNLLNITELDLECWKEYTDAPVQLVDDVSTDAEMRPNLLITTNMPKNTAGNYYCDCDGPYKIKYVVRDMAGNKSDTAVRTIFCIPASGIKDILNIDNLIQVYPNPGDGIIYVRLAYTQKEDLQIMVLDMLGKEILHTRIKGNNLQTEELDLTGAPKGFYLLKVQTGQSIYMKKLQVN
ncbi:MAG: T9SS type A sorting domain-containing protein [Bacteroidota bacterium]|nr:T9SS type A sorting domain-containing protein [Bacteroidota bacterium]